jgi:hypothetical protein
LQNSCKGSEELNTLLWLTRKINQDPKILPDTRIEIVPVNTYQNKLNSFQSVLDLIKKENIVAIIGDDQEDSTALIAQAAASTNILHCAPDATSPSLSDKKSVPTTFRTQVIAESQAKALLSIAQKYKVSSVIVMASQDDLGLGYIQRIQYNSNKYGVNVTLAVTYDQSDESTILTALKTILSSNQAATTIFLQVYGVGSKTFQIASTLGMLNGDYWFITTTGIDERLLSFNIPSNEIRKFSGIWHVERPTPYDISKQGSTPLARDFRAWYRDLFNFDNPSMRGIAKGFDQGMVTLQQYSGRVFNLTDLPNRCNASYPELVNVANTIPTIKYNFVSQKYCCFFWDIND